MITGKPYFDYKFLGVEPFSTALTKSGVTFDPVDHKYTEKLLSDEDNFFSDEDSLFIGLCSKDEKDIYFADFGIAVAPGIQTYVVFLYDHEPAYEDIYETSMEIESLTIENLEAAKGSTPEELN